MNREIKFRAWHSGMKRIIPCEELTNDQLALLANGFFANVHPIKESWTEIFTHEQMCPMQFTGMRDKNGVEIYEGDVVERFQDVGSHTTGYATHCRESKTSRIVGTIVWGSWSWGITTPNFHAFDPIMARQSEVIGNIFENPESLNTE